MTSGVDLHHVGREAVLKVFELSDIDELTAVSNLLSQVWGRNPGASSLPADLLRAMSTAGNYVAGASLDSRMVGGCVGFFGTPDERILHSHIAGVAVPSRVHHVGFALKQHQRAWALDRGVSVIKWTFDPLVRRNAYFNLVKLAAGAVAYLPNFYGPMADEINAGDQTDRLLIRWDLGQAEVLAALAGMPLVCDGSAELRNGASVGLGCGADQRPVQGVMTAARVLVAVPSDIEALRRTDRAVAASWRSALRDVLGGLMADGGRIVGFDRAGWYVVAR